MADSNYSDVVLLLPMSGVDGGTTFTDYSPSPKSVLAYQQAHTEVDQSKFYGSSGYFDGNTDFLYVPTPAGVGNFGTGDFTVEMWVRSASATGGGANYDKLLFGGFATNPDMVFFLDNASLVPALWDGSNSAYASSGVTANQWCHVAYSRASGVLKIFVDGQQKYSGNYGTNFSDNSAYLYVGGDGYVGNRWFNGYLQDLRITKGVARYTDTFTPPGKLIGSISGTIYDANGDAAQRTVIAVPRSYPNSRTFTTQSSAANGTYSLSVPDVECSRIVLADETTLYNDIVDRVYSG